MRKLIEHPGPTEGILRLGIRLNQPVVKAILDLPQHCFFTIRILILIRVAMSPLKNQYLKRILSAFLAARFGHIIGVGNCNMSEYYCEWFLKSSLKGDNSSCLCLFISYHWNPKVIQDVEQPSCSHEEQA